MTKERRRAIARKGGLAKVKKGFAVINKQRRKEIAAEGGRAMHRKYKLLQHD